MLVENRGDARGVGSPVRPLLVYAAQIHRAERTADQACGCDGIFARQSRKPGSPNSHDADHYEWNRGKPEIKPRAVGQDILRQHKNLDSEPKGNRET
jgi:hypothetical protein